MLALAFAFLGSRVVLGARLCTSKLSTEVVTVHYLHDTTAASTQHKTDVMPIYFPESVEDFLNKYGGTDVPEECKDLTYCTVKPPDYPEEHFNKMFKGLKSLPAPSFVMESTLANRQGDPDIGDDCQSDIKYDPLYQVRAKRDSEWRTVVQVPGEDYVQRVRLEICNKPDAPCFNVFPSAPDVKVFCKQKYSKWQVLVANGTGTEKIEVDLPICCSCVYKSASIEARFGIPKQITPASAKKPEKNKNK